MKRINFNYIFLFFSLVLHSFGGFAQTSTFEIFYDNANDRMGCTRTLENESDIQTSQVSTSECLDSSSTLVTPMKYILGDNGKCHAFIDTAPFYFAGEVADSTRCSTSPANAQEVDRSFNVIKYSQHQVDITCSELGNCLNILGPRNQELVDGSIAILEEIAIRNQMQRLRNSVEQDQLNFVQPEFNRSLDQLKAENERCQSNLNYGSGLELEVLDALAGDLRKLEGTLEEDLYVFHWYPGLASYLATSNEGDSNAVARSHARMLQNNYFGWDTDEGTGMQGRGLYASDGPRTTENYGDILLKIRIPAGSRYLNMANGTRKASVIPLSSNTVDLLEQAGCELGGSGFRHAVRRPDGGMDVNKIAFSNTRTCRVIYNMVIDTEDYKFHSYNYSSVPSSICQSETRTAFVLIQNEMSAENVTAFRNPFESRDTMSDEARDLYDLANRRDRLTPSRQQELSEEYGDHLWRCRSDNQH